MYGLSVLSENVSDRSYRRNGPDQMTFPEHSQNEKELTVLFVGTPPVNIEQAVGTSCRRPVTVAVVSDGQEAIQWLSEAGETTTDRSHPDLIVLQFGFESPDGNTLVHAIRSSPCLETVPVVALTADEIGTETLDEYNGNARVATPSSREGYVELVQSIGQFWFEWVRYPPECLFADET